jgi:hypothetical protein
MKNQIIVAVVATAIVVGGGSFYFGMKYGTASSATAQSSGYANENTSGGTRGAGGARGQRGGAGGGFVSGDIIAVDNTGMTIQLRNSGGQGSSTPTEGTGSKIVLFDASTQVMKTAQGSLKDLTVGEQVTTTGTANSDGSVTAQSIQIRPTPQATTGH